MNSRQKSGEGRLHLIDMHTVIGYWHRNVDRPSVRL